MPGTVLVIKVNKTVVLRLVGKTVDQSMNRLGGAWMRKLILPVENKQCRSETLKDEFVLSR